MDEEIRRLIEILDLKPLPLEGGLFRQSYRSAGSVPAGALPQGVTGEKPWGTAIYYLLTAEPENFSALHTLPTDEILHFYKGDPLETLLLYPDGSSRTMVLGQDILGGQQVQLVVPAGVWQGTRVLPGGRYGLIGSTMAPGYTDEDFILGVLEPLLAAYPAEAERIRMLTNPDSAV